MMKFIKNKMYLPIIIGCFVLIMPTIAHAGLLMDILEFTLNTMGIDTNISCSTPYVDKSFCLFCPMFKAIFNAGSLMAGRAYNVFSSSLAEVLLVFLGVSLSLMVLKQLASMSAKDYGSMMNDILRKVFVVIVIYMIITKNYYEILTLTLVPVFETVMSFISTNNDPQSMVSCSNSGGIIGFGDVFSGSSRGGIPISVGKMIVCCVQSIENKINLLFEYGEWAICRGTGPDRILFLIPRIIAIVDGIILYVAGVFFMMTYPWVMADAVFQLGIAMTLLPFAICGYAFNGTKGYLSKIWDWILNTLFVFMFMAILLNCILGYIESILINATSNVSASKVFYDGNRGLAFWGPNMFMLIFVLILGMTYMPIVSELAKFFAGGSGMAAGAKIGQAISSKMDEVSGKLADKMGTVAAKGAGAVYRGAKNGTRNIARVGMSKFVNKFGKDNGSGGKKIKIGNLSFETNVDPNTGKTLLKRTWTNPLNGRTHSATYDRYSTIKEVTDKNGNVISSDVKFRHSFVNDHMFDEKGNINQGAMDHIMNSPLAQNPKYREMMMAKFATMALEKKGIKVGKNYNSRKITTDPKNPNKITVEQVDHNGRITRFSMEIDPKTGRTSIAHMTQHKNGEASSYVNNGMVEISTRRKSNGEEVTTYKYSEEAQKNHRHFSDKREDGKIVDSNGKIAKDLDPNQGGAKEKDLMFGMDALSDLGVVPAGLDAKEYVVKEILANGARNKTNRLSTSLLENTYRMQDFVDENGKINGDAVRKVLNSSIARDPKYRGKIMDAIATDALKKRGCTFGDNYKSRDVIIDPKNPNKVLIKQVNSEGQIINASMEINPFNGQPILSYYNEQIISNRYGTTDDRVLYFDNGSVEINSYRRWGVSGTDFKYSDGVMEGRAGIGDVVDANGIIASDLVGSDFHKNGLLYGIDALEDVANVQAGHSKDILRSKILAEGTRRGSTSLDYDIMSCTWDEQEENPTLEFEEEIPIIQDEDEREDEREDEKEEEDNDDNNDGDDDSQTPIVEEEDTREEDNKDDTIPEENQETPIVQEEPKEEPREEEPKEEPNFDREREERYNIDVDTSSNPQVFETNQQLMYGNLSYEEARAAAELVRQHPGGVCDFTRVEQGAIESYAMSHEDDVDVRNGGGRVIITAKNEEAQQRIDEAVHDSIQSERRAIDADTTTNVMNAIRKDESISDAEKERLIRQEANEYFERIDSGTYDGHTSDKYIQRNRERDKKNLLQQLKIENPELAQQLAEEQGIELR